FSGVPTFMRLPYVPQADELDIALIGIPFDGGTTYRPGPRFGPRNIRVQSAMIRPWNPVLKVNPFERWRIGDFGDLSINPLSIEDTYKRITDQLPTVSPFRSDCVGRSMEKATSTLPESMGSRSLLPNSSIVMDWARFSGI